MKDDDDPSTREAKVRKNRNSNVGSSNGACDKAKASLSATLANANKIRTKLLGTVQRDDLLLASTIN